MKKIYMMIIALLMISGAAGYAVLKGGAPAGKPKEVFTIYKSDECGCCNVYAKYLQKYFDVKIVETDDATRSSKGVPQALGSCHTGVVGDYFVEGHVPIEAVNRLLEDKPDIKGIALPGMPQGSPGMPGAKDGPFVVYKVSDEGNYSEFMRL